MKERDALLAATRASAADLAALRHIMIASGLPGTTIDELIFDDEDAATLLSQLRDAFPQTTDALKSVVGFGVERFCSALGLVGASTVWTVVLAFRAARALDRLAGSPDPALLIRRRMPVPVAE